MPRKIKLTRPELKRHRDALTRYDRYLPMLKLKQQQLQMAVRDAIARRVAAARALALNNQTIDRYEPVFADRAGIPLDNWARPQDRTTSTRNIAGVEITILEHVTFPSARHSLFATPPWVDQALADLRERSWRQEVVRALQEEEQLLRQSLTRIIQRVNLFEKVMIPHARNAIRVIRISLGDERTAAVGRAKIAKSKLAATLAAGDE